MGLGEAANKMVNVFLKKDSDEDDESGYYDDGSSFNHGSNLMQHYDDSATNIVPSTRANSEVLSATQGELYSLKVMKISKYEDVQEIGNAFKDGFPIIMNLESLDTDVAKRVVDFSSGLKFALDGKLTTAGNNRIYILVPSNGGVVDTTSNKALDI